MEWLHTIGEFIFSVSFLTGMALGKLPDVVFKIPKFFKDIW